MIAVLDTIVLCDQAQVVCAAMYEWFGARRLYAISFCTPNDGTLNVLELMVPPILNFSDVCAASWRQHFGEF